jgi:hypothetical protein
MERRRLHLRQHRQTDGADGTVAPAGDEMSGGIEVGKLAHVFAVPPWLRDLGFMSWLVVGG